MKKIFVPRTKGVLFIQQRGNKVKMKLKYFPNYVIRQEIYLKPIYKIYLNFSNQKDMNSMERGLLML